MNRATTGRRWRLWLAGLALFALSLACGQWVALRDISRGLVQQVEAGLPPQVSWVSEDWDGRGQFLDHFVQTVNADLASLPLARPLGPFRQCSARVLALEGEAYGTRQTGEKPVPLTWRQGEHRRSMALGLRCQRNWPWLLAVHGGLAALALLLLAVLPVPVSTRRQDMQGRLAAQGVSARQARQLCAGLDHLREGHLQALDVLLGAAPEDGHRAVAQDFALLLAQGDLTTTQVPWFEAGLRHYAGDCERALAVARHDDELVLQVPCCTVRVHGLAIGLSTTPFFYYLWYARLRLVDTAAGGWLVNPATHRADPAQGAALADLMAASGGHSKAIRDLREKGLRAKTLDQNRSKIKDQLCAVLGEPLAAPYLFEMERDERTARFRCRLALTPARICIEGASGALKEPHDILPDAL
ncbi:hypothetical protein [Parahaliea mediterranea]|uniref:hypothetical protein n=1 Tax=Parahaliea mediterranea TaxID=651086 RepID=UPI001300B970|nr:hypothetical protein [Parahaliea mediterranea]